MHSRFLPLLAILATAGCSNAGEDFGLPPLREGGLAVAVILDRDGSGGASAADTTFAGARVALFIAGSVDTFRTSVSNAEGVAVFEALPVGRYTYAVVPGSVGDSLPVINNGPGSVRITSNPDSLGFLALTLVSYQTLTLAEARSAAPGRRVFVHGLISSALQYHTDSASYLTGAANIRVTNSEHRPGRTGNNPGDSVVVFGTTGSQAGQPVLLDGLIQTISERTAPVATEVAVAEVNTARSGELDAALARVGTATVGDTATVGEFFHVHIAAGADTALVIFDPKLQVPKAAFTPSRPIEVRGMLVPQGDGSWYLKPRPVSGEVFFP